MSDHSYVISHVTAAVQHIFMKNHPLNEITQRVKSDVLHRSCKDIFYIPEFIKNNPTASAQRDIKNKLDSIVSSLKAHHEGLQKEKGQPLKRKAEVLAKIGEFRKEINTRFDELEKKSVADIEDRYKTLINQIEQGMRMLDANEADIKSAQVKVQSPGINVSQDFVNAKKSKIIASNASQSIERTISCIHKEDVDITPDQRIPALLAEITVLGKITQRTVGTTESASASNVQSQIKRQEVYSAFGNAQKTDALITVNGVNKYPVKIKSDNSNCDIVSACTLEDGKIILSDCDNYKLKCLDNSTYTVTDYCDLPGRPWQVCSISNQEVAVCLPDQQAVEFISVRKRLTKTKQIKTDFNCYGLAYAYGNLFISDFDTSVYIYGVSGSKLKQFSEDQSGQELFCNINSLAVSKDGSKIYVSDCDKGLIVLDNNGQDVGRFNGPQLNGAHDCYLTDTGSLLVCGLCSNNVLQFGQNGEFRKVALEFKDKQTYHKAICCN